VKVLPSHRQEKGDENASSFSGQAPSHENVFSLAMIVLGSGECAEHAK